MRALLFVIGFSLLQGASPRSAEIRINELVGTEWISGTREFFLYATEPEKDRSTTLYVDDVARIALAVLTAGDFAFSLEQGAGQMEIRYLPADVEAKLTPMLRRTTVEDTLLKTDRFLKDIAQGHKVGDGLRLGSSELFLCGRAVEEWLRSGKTLESYPMVPYVTFYELRARYRFDGFRGVGVWFDAPQILVRAASRQGDAEIPACADRFAASLSGRMEQLLTHPKTGGDFRRLKALLVLTKVFGWAGRMLVPVDRIHLAALKVREIRNKPVPLRKLPLVIAAPGQSPQALTVRGGVLMSWNPAFLFPGIPARPSQPALTPASQGRRIEANEQRRASVPSFASSLVSVGDRRLLKIDITGILGLKRGTE
jgi:hypothetical protein